MSAQSNPLKRDLTITLTVEEWLVIENHLIGNKALTKFYKEGPIKKFRSQLPEYDNLVQQLKSFHSAGRW